MEKFKEIMKRIGELIKSFANPVEPEKSFDELAVEAGISDSDLKLLKSSIGGVNWDFSEEIEETRKRKNLAQNQPQNQVEQNNVAERKNIELERD
mgnify:CR=1 FL=1